MCHYQGLILLAMLLNLPSAYIEMPAKPNLHLPSNSKSTGQLSAGPKPPDVEGHKFDAAFAGHLAGVFSYRCVACGLVPSCGIPLLLISSWIFQQIFSPALYTCFNCGMLQQIALRAAMQKSSCKHKGITNIAPTLVKETALLQTASQRRLNLNHFKL